MSEVQLGQGYLSYLHQHTYPDAFPTHSQDWSRLLTQRRPIIEKSKDLLMQIAPAAPLFTCSIAQHTNKVDFDFAGKERYVLSVGLYDAVANKKLAYDSNGNLIIAEAGQLCIPQPFVWDPEHDKRGHFVFEKEKVAKVPPGHIAAELQRHLTTLLNPKGLTSGVDIALLLGQVVGDTSPNPALLRHLGIPG